MRNKKSRQRGKQMSTFLNPKKCKATGKTSFDTEKMASQSMMRMWSHDPKADIFDLHVYICPDCNKFHIGHKSYYEQAKANGTQRVSSNIS